VADAAGADAVLFTGDAVDPHNGKCVRASTGSVFHVALGVEPDPRRAITACRRAGLQVLAADAGTGRDLDDVVDAGILVAPTAWLFGNEAHGLDRELLAAADHAVAVPLHGRAESLNLAAAAAVCLYASARAHRRRPAPESDHLRSDQN
jgi:TrmH family RNA methyltransferase